MSSVVIKFSIPFSVYALNNSLLRLIVMHQNTKSNSRHVRTYLAIKLILMMLLGRVKMDVLLFLI